MTVRQYQLTDYPNIRKWWPEGEAPLPEYFQSDTTFIVQNAQQLPLLTLTTWLTNNKNVCLVENLACNPEVRGSTRKSAFKVITEYVTMFLKNLGYTTAICNVDNKVLARRYKMEGFVETANTIMLKRKL